MEEKKGFLSGWSTLEVVLLAVVGLILVVGVVLAVVVGGVLLRGEESGQAAVATLPASPAVSGTPGAAPTSPAGPGEGGDQVIVLSPSTGSAGDVISVEGAGWPVGRRVVISLVPSQPPALIANSAIVDDAGLFKVEIVVPSDPRWLEESPVPVLAQLDDGSLSAQALLVISSPAGVAPAVTPVSGGAVSGADTIAVNVIISIQPTATPPPPPPSVARLTVNASALNVRKGPGTNYDIVGVLTNGQQAEIIGRNADASWWQIKFPGAPQGVGWVSAAYVTAENIANVPVVQAPPPPPPPPPTPTPVPNPPVNEWLGEYYSNIDLGGAPALVRNDVAISFDWGTGSPAPQVPADNFSARWTRKLNFSAGTYRFYARVDDGVRLWVDGALLMNQWRDSSPVTYVADVYLNEGSHDIRMEYYERTLGAVAMLSWERVDVYPNWKAEYFNNPNLQGAPVLVRNETSISYYWGTGSPAPNVPNTNFSARWTRTVYLESGNYVFRVQSDDGVRVWLNNDLVIDRWVDGYTGWLEAERQVPAGQYQIRVEYYQRGGNALVEFTFGRKDQAPQPPIAVIKSPSEGTAGTPVNFDGRSSRPGDARIVRYEWQFGDGTGGNGDKVSHTYTAPGTYRVSLRVTDERGLSGSTSVDIRIQDDMSDASAPIAIISAPSSAVEGQVITFDGSHSQSKSPIVLYQWSFGDGATAQGVVMQHAYAKAGTYRVTLTVQAQNGLLSTATQDEQISSQLDPLPVGTIVAPDVAQVGQAVDFVASTTKTAVRITNYLWNFGDGGSADGPNVPHTYQADGTYNVTLTLVDEYGRTSPSYKLIEIVQAPPPDATPIPSISGPSQARVGDTVTFDGSGSVASTPLDDNSFAWQLGDGASGPGRSITHVYGAPGDYSVTLTVTDQNSQSNNTSAPIRIDPPPAPPQPVITGPDQGVVGKSVDFSSTDSQASSPIAKIEWDLGDGSTADTPQVSHAYQAPGAYNVVLKLTDQDGLEGVTQKPVQINPAASNNPPVVVINAPATAEVGQPVLFDGSSSYGDNALVDFTWDFGDGVVDYGPQANHTYSQAGTYDVTLTVTDDQGLVSSNTVQIQVQAGPEPLPNPPQPVISAPSEATVGETITFDGSGSLDATGFAWDLGDGTQAPGPRVDHVYNAAGTYNVTLTVSNLAGSNATSVQIAVREAEVILPTPQLPTPELKPATPEPTPAPPEPTPAPQPPQAVINAPSQAQVGDTVAFDAGFSQGSSPIVSYQWDLGDGATATGMGVTYSYGTPGVYQVTLTVVDQNGLSGTDSVAITIEALPPPPPPPTPEPTPVPLEPTPVPPEPTPAPQPPQAVINGPSQGMAGDVLQFDASFSQASSPIVSYQWDFGDGTFDGNSGMGVLHSYSVPGVYNVTLTVTDQNGLSDSTNMVVTIGASAMPQPLPAPAAAPQPQSNLPVPPGQPPAADLPPAKTRVGLARAEASA